MLRTRGFVVGFLTVCTLFASTARGSEERTTYLQQIQGLGPNDSYVYWRPLAPEPQAESIIAYRDFPKNFFKMRRVAKVEEGPDTIVVAGELSAICFDRRSGGVRDARMRDVTFHKVWLGEAVLRTADGQTYRGRDFRGNLEVKETEDFIVLSGDFAIPGSDGGTYGRARLTYRVDPYIGFVQAEFEALTDLPDVVKLTFHYSLGDGSARLLPDFFTIDENGWWGAELPGGYGPICYHDLPAAGQSASWRIPRADGSTDGRGSAALAPGATPPDRPASIMPGSTKAGGRYYYAKQTDGRICLEVICPGWWNADFDEAARSHVKNDMFMRMGVREGDEAFMDIHFINRQVGKAIPAGTTYRTCFSTLPFRKLRPFAESYAGNQFDGTTVSTLKKIEQHVKTLAGLGATEYQGSYSIFIRDDGSGHPVVSHVDLAPPGLHHRWGLRSMSYIGQSGNFRVKLFDHFGQQYSRQDAQRDLFRMDLGWPSAQYNPAVISQDEAAFGGAGPEDLVVPCINAPTWRNFVLENIRKNIWERIPTLDTLYVDDLCQYQCSNPAHGCSALGSTWWMGQYEYGKDIKKMMDGLPGNHYLTFHTGLTFTNAHAHSDFHINGEQSMAHMISRRAELNTGYNTSLLYGTQGCYYTASPGMGLPFTTRLFELALARCHQVLFCYFDLNGDGKPDGAPFYSEEDIQRHQRYMGPLQIFDIARSELHHPFDSDYGEYCKAHVDGIRVVLYTRPKDVLMTVAREGVAVKKAPDQPAVFDLDRRYDPVPVELNLAKMGFRSRQVWVYETTGPNLKRYAVRSGRLQLPPIDVNDGPRIFRIVEFSDSPRILWHDVVGWRLARVIADTPDEFAFDMAGAPGHSGTVLMLCGERAPVPRSPIEAGVPAPSKARGAGRRPEAVGGDAALISYDAKNRLAEIRVNYSENIALGRVRIRF